MRPGCDSFLSAVYLLLGSARALNPHGLHSHASAPAVSVALPRSKAGSGWRCGRGQSPDPLASGAQARTCATPAAACGPAAIATAGGPAGIATAGGAGPGSGSGPGPGVSRPTPCAVACASPCGWGGWGGGRRGSSSCSSCGREVEAHLESQLQDQPGAPRKPHHEQQRGAQCGRKYVWRRGGPAWYHHGRRLYGGGAGGHGWPAAVPGPGDPWHGHGLGLCRQCSGRA